MSELRPTRIVGLLVSAEQSLCIVRDGSGKVGGVLFRAAIICVIIPVCLLVVLKVLSVGAGITLGIFGSFGFIVLIYPVMLCWMVMVYHLALPGDLPANTPKDGPKGR